jgi:hypothetical protein
MNLSFLIPALRPLLSPAHRSPVHLSPALAQRALAQRVIGTLPKSSAHTLANWQPAPGAIQTPLLSAIANQDWQSGKLAFRPKRGAHYETVTMPRTRAAFLNAPPFLNATADSRELKADSFAPVIGTLSKSSAQCMITCAPAPRATPHDVFMRRLITCLTTCPLNPPECRLAVFRGAARPGSVFVRLDLSIPRSLDPSLGGIPGRQARPPSHRPH